MTMIENERSLYRAESSSGDEDYEYETTAEDFEPSEGEHPSRVPEFPNLRSINNYLNNLNMSFNRFNFNSRINDLVTGGSENLWKIYENSRFHQVGSTLRKPKIESIANLWKQLGDEEYEAALKRLEFEQVRQKASEEVQRRLGPKLRRQRSAENNRAKVESQPAVKKEEKELLNQEFWTQLFGLKTEEAVGEMGGVVGDGDVRIVDIPPNPFYSRLTLRPWDWIKIIPIGGILAVVRAVLVLCVLLVGGLLVTIGCCGLSEEDRKRRPLSWWRRTIKWIVAHVIMRLAYLLAGFWWVKKIGRQASSAEAPLIVCAPHSSYMDAFIIPLLGGPSVVAKAESQSIFIFGKMIDFTQPIYVDRSSEESRRHCREEIHRRAAISGEENWPQVFIFPEGTCSNRSALAQFRAGAFEPGVPVQPVVIRYPNETDSLSWTWDSPSAFWSAFVTLSQFYNNVQLEFLPVYHPSAQEKGDARLYAANVQAEMARALNVPNSDYTVYDGVALARLASSSVRRKMQRIWEIKGKLNVREVPTETSVVYERATGDNIEWTASFAEFREMFQIPQDSSSDKSLRELYQMFVGANGENDTIDLRPYLVLCCFMYSVGEVNLLQRLIFRMYAGTAREMSEGVFVQVMAAVFEEKRESALKTYSSVNPSIPLDEFERKTKTRMDFLKFYAMEVTGQLTGNYPRRSQRDQEPSANRPHQD